MVGLCYQVCFSRDYPLLCLSYILIVRNINMHVNITIFYNTNSYLCTVLMPPNCNFIYYIFSSYHRLNVWSTWNFYLLKCKYFLLNTQATNHKPELSNFARKAFSVSITSFGLRVCSCQKEPCSWYILLFCQKQ